MARAYLMSRRALCCQHSYSDMSFLPVESNVDFVRNIHSKEQIVLFCDYNSIVDQAHAKYKLNLFGKDSYNDSC
jgi:hypothetical protein